MINFESIDALFPKMYIFKLNSLYITVFIHYSYYPTEI